MAVDAINGSMGLMDDVPTDEATARRAEVLNTTEPLRLSKQMFYSRGKISRVTTFEAALWSAPTNKPR